MDTIGDLGFQVKGMNTCELSLIHTYITRTTYTCDKTVLNVETNL